MESADDFLKKLAEIERSSWRETSRRADPVAWHAGSLLCFFAASTDNRL